MSTVRGVKDRRFKFVQLLNSMFEDQNLSLKAKGFIGYCLTKKEDWRFHVSHLCSVLKEGEKAIYSVINECIEQGYAYRYQPRGKDGDLLQVETIVSDSKFEIEAIKKEIESDPDFKKCLPDRHFRDAVKVDAENAPISNIGEDSNIGKQQQQHARPPGFSPPQLADPAAAASSSKTKQKGVVVYPSLKTVDIPEKDKIEICSMYKEHQVSHAVAWCFHPLTKINKGVVPALKWACKTKPDLPKSADEISSINRKYALRYDEVKSGQNYVMALSSCVEIVYPGSPKSFVLNYDENGFIDQFQNALRKSGFKILQE